MADEKKGWGSTVLGWFVEFDETGEAPKAGSAPKPPSGGDAATDDIIRRYAGGAPGKGAPAKGTPPAKGAAKPAARDTAPANSPSGEAPPDFGGAGVAAPPVGAGGTVDFKEVFRKSGITDEEADRVQKALTLLAQLPAETPMAVKKQIVEASLKTFNVPIESIIESSVAEIEALHGCITAGAAETAKLLEQSEARIQKLQQEIADVRGVMETRKNEQRALEIAARAQGLKVQQILEFFGQDVVSKVVKDSPRLHEPAKS